MKTQKAQDKPLLPLEYATELVRQATSEVIDADIEPIVTVPELKFGDFTTNVAMQLQRQTQQSPRDLAQAIAANLVGNDDVMSAEVAGPGFINVRFSDSFWLKQVKIIDKNYCKNTQGQGQKVQVEFISANPTGPLTLGNARGGFIGDVLGNVLATQGHEVVKEYYFNDAGTQINKLIEAVKAEAGLIQAEDRQYNGEYITELAKDFQKELEALETNELKKLLTQAIFERYIRPDIYKMGIEFDTWFNETTIIEDGTLEKTKKLLEDNNLLFERDGAVWVKTDTGGDPRKERVFIKSNGDPAYFAPDIAYHVKIFGERGFDVAIKELGPDHIAQFPSVQAVIRVLFPDKELKMVAHQQLRLVQGDKEVKMSKRLGQFVTVGELMGKVGSDVARWFMLMRSNDSHMDFDLDLAASQSQKNPFWYVMYSYVRANSIIKESHKVGLSASGEMKSFSKTEKAIIHKLTYLPLLVEEISKSYHVHQLTFYGQELAGLFHEWYENTRVIGEDTELAGEKLYFLEQFTTAMEVYFEILGIKPIKHM